MIDERTAPYGAYVRTVSLALVPLLLGTILFLHGANGWAFGNEGGGWEYPAFQIAASIAQALLGADAYALKPREFGSTASRPAIA